MPIEITIVLIQGAFTLSATIIAAICAAFIGKKFHDRNKLKCQLDEAREDIEFLLCVEKIYGSRLKELSGSSGKINVRDLVRTTKDLKWSGNNTPGRVSYKNC